MSCSVWRKVCSTPFIDGSEGGHFDWHKDHGNTREEPRKISLSLQLSQGNAYEGCDLQLQSAGHIQTAPRSRGALIAFPSYALHRVTPIQRGCASPR